MTDHPETLETQLLTIADPDGFYDELVAMHDGLSPDESTLVNWRLILILANQIGDRATLSAAMEAARIRV